MQNRILMGVRVYPFDEELIDAMRRERATILFVSPLKSDSIREQPDMVARLAEAGDQDLRDPGGARMGWQDAI